MTSLEEFYHEKEEPVKGCLLALKSIILNYNAEITHKWYYRLPCFMYKKQIFCYLWIDRKTKTPYIAIGKGVKVNHPDLIKGQRTFTAQLMINPNEDIPIETIHNIFDQVMNLY